MHEDSAKHTFRALETWIENEALLVNYSQPFRAASSYLC